MLAYGTLAFTYTENGELATKTDTATGEVTAYSYDALGNLREVVLPDGTDIAYLVDAMGRRVGKKVNGMFVKQWLWRGRLQPVAELDGAGNLTARFEYAAGGNVPSLMVTGAGTYRFVKDHLGSVRQVIDVASGTVAQEVVYDAWGRVQSDTSPGLQPFGFGGGLYDSDTGLERFGKRDYDADIGRWVSRDPVGLSGGLNEFAFAGNDPVNKNDMSGRDPTWASWETGQDFAQQVIQQASNNMGAVGAGVGAAAAGAWEVVGQGIAKGFGIGALCLTLPFTDSRSLHGPGDCDRQFRPRCAAVP